MSRFNLRGLYAITIPGLTDVDHLCSRVAAAIAGGATAIQYRDKSDNTSRRRQEAEALLSLCRQNHVPLIINDDVSLAEEIGADGVHLGRDDGDISAARNQLGPDTLIGISCYNELGRALAAQAAGADYVAFGRFFPSRSKPAAVSALPHLLSQARANLQVPIVAIGGITPDNGGALIQAGADMLAVIDAVFGQTDPQAAARSIATLF